MNSISDTNVPSAVAEEAIPAAVPDNATSDNIHNDVNNESESDTEQAEEEEATEPENVATDDCVGYWSFNINLIIEYMRAIVIGGGLGFYIQVCLANTVAGMCITLMFGAIYAIYCFCQIYIANVNARNAAETEMMRQMYTFYRNPTVTEYQNILDLMQTNGNQTRYVNWIAAVMNNYPQMFQGRNIENEVCHQGIQVAAAAYFDITTTMPENPINVTHFVQCAVARYGATGKRDHRIQDWQTREDFTFSQRSQFAILDLIFDEIDRSVPFTEKPIQQAMEVNPVPATTEIQSIEEKTTEPVAQPNTNESFSFSSFFSRF